MEPDDESTGESPSPQPTSPGESPSEPSGPTAAPSDSSSKASSAASPLIGDAGPGFDPGSAPEPEPGAELHALPDPGLEWAEDSVRGILTAQGAAAHAIAGVGEEDWVYTASDLDAIAPPLTRILNRYDATRAAAAMGDEAAVVIGFGGYITRSYLERLAVLQAEAETPEVPITGVVAPEGTGPEDEPGEEMQWTTSN